MVHEFEEASALCVRCGDEGLRVVLHLHEPIPLSRPRPLHNKSVLHHAEFQGRQSAHEGEEEDVVDKPQLLGGLGHEAVDGVAQRAHDDHRDAGQCGAGGGGGRVHPELNVADDEEQDRRQDHLVDQELRPPLVIERCRHKIATVHHLGAPRRFEALLLGSFGKHPELVDHRGRDDGGAGDAGPHGPALRHDAELRDVLCGGHKRKLRDVLVVRHPPEVQHVGGLESHLLRPEDGTV
mmetsp:Transcript_19012/g.54202  ORF Transcript_19012/g.54202 Transcript_19012/m.54202 type:complete len:237 (-) Transcript_19012:446-1156(-)